MAMNKIETDSSWGAEASKINQNFQSISTDLTKVKMQGKASFGPYKTSSNLPSGASENATAWVSATLTPPFEVWQVQSGKWTNTGFTYTQELGTGDLATKDELAEQDAKLTELSSAIGGTFNVSLPLQKTGKYYSGSVGSTFTEIENEDSIYFDYIDISSANRITININSSVTSTSRKILAVDTDNRIVSSKSEGDVKETVIKEIVFDSVELQNSSKLLISIHKTSSINFISVEGTGIKGEVANNKQEISKINDSLSDIDRKVDNIEGKIVGGETDIDLGDELTDYSYFGSSGEEVETTITKSSTYYNPIVLSNSGKIEIRLSGYGAASARSIGIASSAGIWKEVVLEKNPTRIDEGIAVYEFNAEAGDKLYVSYSSAYTLVSAKQDATSSFDEIKSSVDSLKSNNEEILKKIDTNEGRIDNIEGKIVGGETDIDLQESESAQYYSGSVGENVETISNNSSICYNPIVLSNSGKIEIRLSGYGATSSRSIGIASSAGIWKEVVLEKNPTRIDEGIAVYEFNAEAGDKLYVSYAKASTLVSAKQYVKSLADEVKDMSQGLSNNIIYVDCDTGNDENDGKSAKTSLRTLKKAIEISGSDVNIIFRGVCYGEYIDFSKINKKSLKITGKSGQKNRIIGGDKLTGGSYVSDNVYKYSYNNSKLQTNDNYYLFQYDINDESTLIPQEERHPLYRGKEYRCDCLKLTKKESKEEFDSASEYCYYYDGDNSELYVRIKEGSNVENNPVFVPGDPVFQGNDGSVHIELTNFDCYFGAIDLAYSHNAIITNCSAKYAFGAAGISWDNAIGIKFYQCESCRTFSGGQTGDGFNAHSNENGTDAAMRHTTALLVDCWSHDNNDDGYSDHQRCETVVIGGLYEYNVKAGLTPSYGAQDTYYNVYCRKQVKSGIALVGAAPPDEGGKGSQVYAYNCVCENNTDNYYVVGTGEQQDIPNTLVLISCRSIKASSAGYKAGTNGEMKLINCTDMESEITKYGTITICNGELVAP